jgi:uncharacterized membrane protein YqiK
MALTTVEVVVVVVVVAVVVVVVVVVMVMDCAYVTESDEAVLEDLYQLKRLLCILI